MSTYEATCALATALGLLEVDVGDLDYDAMTAELATQAEMVTDRLHRAEEVTANCHVIALDYARHLRRPDLTPVQRDLTARAIIALHDCACEHGGADDDLDAACVEATQHTDFCPS